jgi:hypothetical protein
MALEGRGIVWLPLSLIEAELRDGRLIEAGRRAWTIEVEIRLQHGLARAEFAAIVRHDEAGSVVS